LPPLNQSSIELNDGEENEVVEVADDNADQQGDTVRREQPNEVPSSV